MTISEILEGISNHNRRYYKVFVDWAKKGIIKKIDLQEIPSTVLDKIVTEAAYEVLSKLLVESNKGHDQYPYLEEQDIEPLMRKAVDFSFRKIEKHFSSISLNDASVEYKFALPSIATDFDLRFVINAGSASNEDIADLLSQFSLLHKALGGDGIQFSGESTAVVNSKISVL